MVGGHPRNRSKEPVQKKTMGSRGLDRGPIDAAEIDLLRDVTFRRRTDLRLKDLRGIERFVGQVGFAFLYRVKGWELPSVWGAITGRRHPVLPEHTHHDPAVGLAWEAKDVLAARRRIFYGKLLRRAPTLVSLELFPAFYALSGNRGADDDYLRWARDGRLSPAARRIMEVLIGGPPSPTADLKARSSHAGPGRRAAFDRAMAELQERLLVVKYAEVYDPKFTFIWGPLHRWLPHRVEEARRLDPARAREAVLARHLEVHWAVREREAERLFGWARPAISAAAEGLIGRGLAVRFPAAGGGSVLASTTLPGALDALRAYPNRRFAGRTRRGPQRAGSRRVPPSERSAGEARCRGDTAESIAAGSAPKHPDLAAGRSPNGLLG